MSNRGKSERAWSFYIEDMIGFAEKVLAYTEGMDQRTFCDSEITYDAVLRNLELIGEAAGRIPQEVRDAHREVPWRIMVATRNRLIHADLGIDDDIIWSMIRGDIPELVASLKKLKHDSAED